ncbi:glycosyl transferase family 2 [Methylobacterium sp. 4-46]|uniref:glycosyltransferase family 2 protein n=1 Tax=unclassified Methylobacterium TaxID=2615210 RepID=UPI000165CDF8|nr:MULTISPECIES: glycosyltransferase family 2 protein [Methylobacterium]ACA19212.1 glycosyl transferase family 2 [Methylobacterium sp. 4-46]WFT78419.1 glycosyltransferase family 2 protein [Methylobacterium nodulans]
MSPPPVRLEPHDDPDFARRLVLPGAPGGRWLSLTYAADRFAPAPRPMLRFLGPDPSEALLPGPVLGRAAWLGPVPPGTTAILLAAPPAGFRVEAARLLGLPAVLARAARRRPATLAVALLRAAQRDGRRFRNTLRIAAAVTPLSAYPAWRAERARPFEPALDRLVPVPRRIGLLLAAAPGEEAALRASLSSLLAQSHRDWRLALSWRGAPPAGLPRDPRIGEGAAFPEEVEAVGLLHPGDVLAPDALAQLARALDGADLAYADEEVETPSGLAPRLKPAWSPDLALATGYPGRPMLLARDLLARCGWEEAQGTRALAPAAFLAVAPERVRHVPRILCRRPAGPEAAEPGLLREALRRAGSPARVREEGGAPDLLWPLPDPPPLASVVIPTRDRPDLIRTAVRGVLEETDYPALDLVLVDNGSVDPAVHAFYADLSGDPRVRRIDRPGPFNFSSLVNAGVAAARGSVVVLLNNDVAVRDPRWLAEMVRLAVRPGIGAVGAKLLYGNGRLQHAGVVVGLGGRAGHTLRNRPADTPGHLGRLRVTHEVAGVTAACLAVTRAGFERVGGFDEAAFAVDFNDIDFCLRLREAGLRNLWCPHAVLDHHESVSRGPSVGPARARFEAEAARFTARWRAVIRDDPYYHPAFSVTTFGEDLE